jgi:hypothetical protein
VTMIMETRRRGAVRLRPVGSHVTFMAPHVSYLHPRNMPSAAVFLPRQYQTCIGWPVFASEPLRSFSASGTLRPCPEAQSISTSTYSNADTPLCLTSPHLCVCYCVRMQAGPGGLVFCHGRFLMALISRLPPSLHVLVPFVHSSPMSRQLGMGHDPRFILCRFVFKELTGSCSPLYDLCPKYDFSGMEEGLACKWEGGRGRHSSRLLSHDD